LKEIKSSLKKKSVVLVDARSRPEFEGKIIRAAYGGHIPRAMNIEWKENIENNVFKSSKELQEIYSNLSKDSVIITYCQGGYRAANSFIALKMLGYKNVKIYLDSWGERGNKPGPHITNKLQVDYF
jgi:thiosulfate/3-mercaptopyruvate sulfurtransferase